LLILAAIVLTSCGVPSLSSSSADKVTKMPRASLITVYDNYLSQPGLKTGWGFSCVIKTDKENLLFDTGADSETLLFNMEKLDINPQNIDVVVLSHIHGDHVGGLDGFLEKNGQVKAYIPASFPVSMEGKIKSYGGEVVRVEEPAKIAEGIYSTGELGTWIKEQSLVINTKKGLVVITGCSHPGIVNIVEKTKEIVNKEIYLVLGGFHLFAARDSTLRGIIQNFRDLGVKKAAPSHCSGDRCRELFKQEYKDDFIANGVGKVIEI